MIQIRVFEKLLKKAVEKSIKKCIEDNEYIDDCISEAFGSLITKISKDALQNPDLRKKMSAMLNRKLSQKLLKEAASVAVERITKR